MTVRDESPASTHPPLPPTSEDDQFHRLRLLRSRRVGISTYRRLITEHGNAKAALDALPDVAAAAGVNEYQACPEAVVHKELRDARSMGARLILEDSADYPENLKYLADAPPFLWAMGNVPLLHSKMIALVGARNASSLGTRMARKLASDLGDAGYVVVSGLARGIDTAAHLATLKSGTVAVLAGGVDVIYPAENSELASGIARNGLRLSEQPMGQQPAARMFPARNRIIAGLAEATIVVEAATKSGSLITARDALDLGRDVLAVPGHPFDARAAGCNMLIRDGATLVRDARDVIESLTPISQEKPPEAPAPAPAKRRELRDVSALHTQILNRLGPSPTAEDQLIRDLAIEAEEATPALLELELSGQIARRPGGLLTRVS